MVSRVSKKLLLDQFPSLFRSICVAVLKPTTVRIKTTFESHPFPDHLVRSNQFTSSTFLTGNPIPSHPKQRVFFPAGPFFNSFFFLRPIEPWSARVSLMPFPPSQRWPHRQLPPALQLSTYNYSYSLVYPFFHLSQGLTRHWSLLIFIPPDTYDFSFRGFLRSVSN